MGPDREADQDPSAAIVVLGGGELGEWLGESLSSVDKPLAAS